MNLIDEQIIKALECCKKAKLNQDCLDLKCPFSTEYGCDIGLENLRNEALDLINRKDKRIAELEEEINRQKAEIKRLYIEGLQINKTFMDFVNKQITEAIKEFAERLIHEIVNRPSEIQSTSVEYLHGSAYRQNEIVDLVKEMVGESNV